MQMIDFDAIQAGLEKIVNHFEKSAPTVSNWANDLFIKVSEDFDAIRLVEIRTAERIISDCMGSLNGSSYAANMVYKLKNRLGQDTTGDFGF